MLVPFVEGQSSHLTDILLVLYKMGFQVLTVVKMSMTVFWVVMLCGLVVGTNVSDEHTASIFKAEVLHYVLNARATDYPFVVYLMKMCQLCSVA
jgi:hypothetical protein